MSRVVARQLHTIARRLEAADSPACLAGWTDRLLTHTMAHWDDDLGGRSTRDFIEENVVEAIAEALDGLDASAAPGSVPVRLDARSGAEAGDGAPRLGRGEYTRVICERA